MRFDRLSLTRRFVDTDEVSFSADRYQTLSVHLNGLIQVGTATAPTRASIASMSTSLSLASLLTSASVSLPTTRAVPTLPNTSVNVSLPQTSVSNLAWVVPSG